MQQQQRATDHNRVRRFPLHAEVVVGIQRSGLMLQSGSPTVRSRTTTDVDVIGHTSRHPTQRSSAAAVRYNEPPVVGSDDSLPPPPTPKKLRGNNNNSGAERNFDTPGPRTTSSPMPDRSSASRTSNPGGLVRGERSRQRREWPIGPR